MTKKAINKCALIEQCRNSLTKLGCYMFLEMSALMQPRTLRSVSEGVATLPQPGASMLLRWTKALIRAGDIPFKLKTAGDESGLKALISRWQKIHRGHVDRKDKNPGLEFIVSSITLKSSENVRRWNGRLILIYERKTDSLFHYMVEIGAATEASPSLVWFAIGQAMKIIEESGECINLLSECRTVIFPSCLFGRPINSAYGESANIFINAKKNGRTLRIVWPKGNEQDFNVDQWRLKWYIGRPHFPIVLEMDNIKELRREMGSLATTVSKKLRERKSNLRATSMSADSITPSWRKLNAIGVRVRKSSNRFDR